MRYTYLLVDLFSILFPFIFSFHKKIKFSAQWRFLALPGIFTALFFIFWDILFTNINVWSFNPRYVLGYYFFNLPIEEVLFFICIPYACVFSYYCIKTFLKLAHTTKPFYYFTFALAALLTCLALSNVSKIYTSVTFILTSLLLLFLTFKRMQYLKAFLVSFIFILIPFFITNGILTGAITDEPVVIYNKVYNLNIRLLTIPVEDVFYGMLLILMNISGYEWLKGRHFDNKLSNEY